MFEEIKAAQPIANFVGEYISLKPSRGKASKNPEQQCLVWSENELNGQMEAEEVMINITDGNEPLYKDKILLVGSGRYFKVPA